MMFATLWANQGRKLFPLFCVKGYNRLTPAVLSGVILTPNCTVTTMQQILTVQQR